MGRGAGDGREASIGDGGTLMDVPITRENLEIEVQDFGPIARAKLDLRPMTVFIGPSNTGKSYLAVLLYALHRFFGTSNDRVSGAYDAPPLLVRTFGHRYFAGLTNPLRRLSTEIMELLNKLENEIGAISRENSHGLVELPGPIVEFFRSELDNMDKALESEIQHCFGLDNLSALVRKGRNTRANVVIRRGYAHRASALTHTIEINDQRTRFHSAVPDYTFIPPGTRIESIFGFAMQDIHAEIGLSDSDVLSYKHFRLIRILLDLMIPSMVDVLRLPAFYLPADRTGVMHAHSAVVSAMLANAPMLGLQPTRPTPLLSGVLADFLSQLIRIDQAPIWSTTQRSIDRPDRGQQIEKTILRGVVGVERSELINYPHFTYRPDGWKEDLPLMHSSSMVSELAPVVLFLRHLVQPGNVLIIEEPESHLHPAMQVEFTRQLTKLVQAGYRVIITTHSEWILEELANVVRRSQLPLDQLATVSESDAALTADQIGVWEFRPRPRTDGSEVVQITPDESGLYDTAFDDVAIGLHNDYANISTRIGNDE